MRVCVCEITRVRDCVCVCLRALLGECLNHKKTTLQAAASKRQPPQWPVTYLYQICVNIAYTHTIHPLYI